MVKETKVLIGGQVYTLSSEQSEEYMQKVALYLNKKLEELTAKTNLKRMNSRMQSILLSLNIVDDLFQEKQKYEEEMKKVEQLSAENRRLQDEIEKKKQELDEYLKILNAE